MKKFVGTIALCLLTCWSFAQELKGAWQLDRVNGKKVEDRVKVKIYQDGYFAFGEKEKGNDHFISAGGGEFELEGEAYREMFDFNTQSPEKVGEAFDSNLNRKENQLIISHEKNNQTYVEIWKLISDAEDDLTRHWVITGRMRDGEISEMTPGDRRTVKILSGGHFQWVAFNSATREFMGTGGGTYTAEDGKYVENISFFSRDDSRVGASLSFDFEVKEGKWHHSGESSTGNPIYEVWSPYEEAYRP